MIRRWGGRAVGVALVAGAVACSSAAQPAVEATAAQFAGALARHDGEAACALLTDDARRGTETFGRSCAEQQVATLSDPGAIEQVEVWSDAAQVRLAGDTVFLLLFPDGWRISAAGCTPEDEAPYRCEVQG